MSQNKITINGVDYAPVKNEGMSLHIVIVDNRGLTFVGLFDPANPHRIVDARCVIRWGTTGHIAELAKDGPQDNTKLGIVADVILSKTAPFICAYECANAEDWS